MANALGNGRFIRTLAENARALRDLRLAERHAQADPSADELTELTAADLTAASPTSKRAAPSPPRPRRLTARPSSSACQDWLSRIFLKLMLPV